MTDPDSSDSDATANADGGADADANGGRRSKVGRIIDERGFDDLGTELERRWTSDGDDAMSLRELADLFNRRVLADEAEDAGMQFVEGELENFYAKLTAEDAVSETQVAVERRLDREGVDTDELSSDFVTHQAIHTYLTKYRGASHPTPDAESRLSDGRQTINRLQGRLSNVASNTLDTLANAGAIVLGDVDVFVTVTVACKDCGTQREINELLDDGGCDCE